MLDKTIVLILASLTDRTLAGSIVGDLAQERHRRAGASSVHAFLWFAGAAAAIVAHAAVGRLRASASDLWFRRLGASGLFGDTKQAFRALRRTPVVSAVIVATLALGIGVNALSGLVESLLFGITPGDAVARLVVVVLLMSVSLAACLIPARRAARVELGPLLL